MPLHTVADGHGGHVELDSRLGTSPWLFFLGTGLGTFALGVWLFQHTKSVTQFSGLMLAREAESDVGVR